MSENLPPMCPSCGFPMKLKQRMKAGGWEYLQPKDVAWTPLTQDRIDQDFSRVGGFENGTKFEATGKTVPFEIVWVCDRDFNPLGEPDDGPYSDMTTAHPIVIKEEDVGKVTSQKNVKYCNPSYDLKEDLIRVS